MEWLDHLVREQLEHWNDCTDLKEMNLLRLNLLRNIAKKLHQTKSHYLAYGKKQEIIAIKTWEEHLEKLRNLSHLSLSLEELLHSKEQFWSIPQKKYFIPEALFSALRRDALLSLDRQWEASLAAEASRLQWHFWKLNAWVHISFISHWNELLVQTLWPHSILLFMEDAPFQNPHLEDLWHGQWILLLHPNYRHPTELSLDLYQWEGTPTQPPTQPQWKHLYPRHS